MKSLLLKIKFYIQLHGTAKISTSPLWHKHTYKIPVLTLVRIRYTNYSMLVTSSRIKCLKSIRSIRITIKKSSKSTYFARLVRVPKRLFTRRRKIRWNLWNLNGPHNEQFSCIEMSAADEGRYISFWKHLKAGSLQITITMIEMKSVAIRQVGNEFVPDLLSPSIGIYVAMC